MFGRQAASQITPVSYWELLPGCEAELSKAIQVLNYIGPPFVEVGTEFCVYLPQLGTSQLQKFVTSCVTRMATSSTSDILSLVARLPVLLQSAEKDQVKLIPMMIINVVELSGERKCNHLDIVCVKSLEPRQQHSLPRISAIPQHLIEHSYCAPPPDNEDSVESPASDKDDDNFTVKKRSRRCSESDLPFRIKRRPRISRRTGKKRTAKRALSTELGYRDVENGDHTYSGQEETYSVTVNGIKLEDESDSSEPDTLVPLCVANPTNCVDATPKGSHQQPHSDDLIKRRNNEGRKKNNANSYKDSNTSFSAAPGIVSTKMLSDAMLTPTKILEAADALMLLSSPDFQGIPYNSLDISTNSSTCDVSIPSPLTPFKVSCLNSTEISGNTPTCLLASIDSPTVDFFVAPSISSTPQRGTHLPLLTVSGSPSSASWTSLLQSLTPAKEDNSTFNSTSESFGTSLLMQEDIETQVVDLEVTGDAN